MDSPARELSLWLVPTTPLAQTDPKTLEGPDPVGWGKAASRWGLGASPSRPSPRHNQM
jgi:hypothetical protein